MGRDLGEPVYSLSITNTDKDFWEFTVECRLACFVQDPGSHFQHYLAYPSPFNPLGLCVCVWGGGNQREKQVKPPGLGN